MAKPASLGDEEKQEYRYIKETVPMPPGGRKGLLVAIEHALTGGGVQKLVVQVGSDIQVTRAIKVTGVEDVPPELMDDDLMSIVRNVEMEEFLIKKGADFSTLDYLFRAFQKISAKRLRPKVFIVKRLPQLCEWLGVEHLDDLFGVEIVTHTEIPEGTFVFAASNPSDPDEVLYSLRMEIDVPGSNK